MEEVVIVTVLLGKEELASHDAARDVAERAARRDGVRRKPDARGELLEHLCLWKYHRNRWWYKCVCNNSGLVGFGQ